MVSEKDMEDRIAEDPDAFLSERGLSLVARQLRVGPYIFDLLFEDRHGGRLIVELQKGTLDRNHTYKILDYYDEYRERNPTKFIEVMIIANQIPVERKKRLQALGVEFREIPEHCFQIDSSPDSENDDVQVRVGEHTTLSSGDEAETAVMDNSDTGSYHFESLGQSGFIQTVRHAVLEATQPDTWNLGGDASLTGILLPVTDVIKQYIGQGLKAQIWMERPKNENASCKFEVAAKVLSLTYTESTAAREEIASSMRNRLAKAQLPVGVQLASGSTVAKCRVELPGLKEVVDDTIEQSKQYTDQIQQVVRFVTFVETVLSDWTDDQLANEFKVNR